MKKIIHIITFLLAIASAAVLTACFAIGSALPDSFRVVGDSELSISGLSITVSRDSDTIEAVDNSSEGIYNADLKLFGVFPIKNVSVQSGNERYVTVCGTPFGIKIYAEGVLVVGMSDIAVSGGSKNPAKDAGIKIGDVITSVDGCPVKSNSEMAAAIEKSTSDTLSVEGIRDGRTFTVTINPATAKSDGRRKIGLWVRDSSAGIGTMTYYDPALQIAAGLGHGICDVDTGEIMPCGSGEIVTANIYDIVKGTSGSPGELRGRFNTYVSLGEIIINDETGVFAYSGKKFSGETMRIAMRQEVQAGYAQIYTTIDGNGPRYYDCEIQNVRYSDESPTKNMVIKITDAELLEKTGGIVQGMSGSPIIQNGLLVGAVTHVFVNDSSCGYAIFAENMESTAEKAQSLSIDAAS